MTVTSSHRIARNVSAYHYEREVMDKHERIIVQDAANILTAEYHRLMSEQAWYAATSASHAAFEIGHALRQIDAAARESEEVTA